MTYLSRLLFAIGVTCLLLGIYLVWERNNPKRITFEGYTSSTLNTPIEKPVRIVIRSLNIDLPIVPARINESGDWDLTGNGVSYLVSSPRPGSEGNSILYGHNWNNLLGSLHTIQTGDTIEIVYNNKKRVLFIVSAYAVVTPDQSHVLSNSKDTRITLYTCTGFLDRKRFVVTALTTHDTQAKTVTN